MHNVNISWIWDAETGEEWWIVLKIATAATLNYEIEVAEWKYPIFFKPKTDNLLFLRMYNENKSQKRIIFLAIADI